MWKISSLVYWIWLSKISGIGLVIAKALVTVFITPRNIYKVTKSELVNISRIGSATADIILNSEFSVNAEKILKK